MTFNYSVPPAISKFNVEEDLRLGQRVSMLCSVVDGDLPMNLFWFRDEVRLNAGLSEGILVTELGSFESVLRIDNLRPEHNANFTCVAENLAGRAQHSQVLRVKGRPKLSTLNELLSSTHQHRLRFKQHQFQIYIAP